MSDLPDFGEYVEIEQKRYGVPNVMFTYKVIGNLRSNTYRTVPVDAQNRKPVMGEMTDVIRAICCGVCEDRVEKFRACDVSRVTKGFGITEQN